MAKLMFYLQPMIIMKTENNFSDSEAADTFPKPTPVMQERVKYMAVRYLMPLLGPPTSSLEVVVFDNCHGCPVTLASVDSHP